MKNKTVFDTNIWISYFLKAKFTELIDMVFENDVEFFRAKELTAELITVLSREKFKKYLKLPISEYIEFYEELSSLITIVPWFNNCRDPKDNFLFDIAYQSDSQFLVSGDKDVRDTIITRPLKVVTLTKYKELIQY